MILLLYSHKLAFSEYWLQMLYLMVGKQYPAHHVADKTMLLYWGSLQFSSLLHLKRAYWVWGSRTKIRRFHTWGLDRTLAVRQFNAHCIKMANYHRSYLGARQRMRFRALSPQIGIETRMRRMPGIEGSVEFRARTDSIPILCSLGSVGEVPLWAAHPQR